MAKPKRKLGRPREFNRRIPVPYTNEQVRLIDKAAEQAGLTRAAWIRMTTIAAATSATS